MTESNYQGTCDTETGSCTTSSGPATQCQACGTQCGGDPVACAMAMWCTAFCQAMKEVHVDLLKEKIKKAWGAKMDKAADAVVEARGVKWQSMLAEAKAKEEIRTKLQKLWHEGK